MYEEEKKELENYRKKLEELPIDTKKLDEAILKGMQIAEKEKQDKKRNGKRFLYSIAAVAVIFLAFVTSIRFSPVFANVVASIPGMDRIVALIEDDKGMKGIVDNEYYQIIGESATNDNVTLNVEGVILDETGMVLLYSLEAPFGIQNQRYKEIGLLHKEEAVESGVSFGSPDQKHPNRLEDTANFLFTENQLFDEQQFTFFIQLDNQEETMLSVPFTVPKKAAAGKEYLLNQEVTIDSQKLTVHNVIIHPLRAEVNVSFDNENPLVLLQFEDLRIEDEKSEVWGSIVNGISGRQLDNDEVHTLYLQSNYFETPKKLYLKFNEMQALPKEDLFLVVDLENRKVLKQPSIAGFKLTKISANAIEGRFNYYEDFSHAPFSSIKNADSEYVTWRSGRFGHEKDEYTYFTEEFDPQEVINPITFEFTAFPNYIEGDIEIELK